MVKFNRVVLAAYMAAKDTLAAQDSQGPWPKLPPLRALVEAVGLRAIRLVILSVLLALVGRTAPSARWHKRSAAVLGARFIW